VKVAFEYTGFSKLAAMREGFTITCTAGSESTYRDVRASSGSLSGTEQLAILMPFGEARTVQCFALAPVIQRAGVRSQERGGSVVGATERVTVVLPGYGPDADEDGIPDEDDQCPDEKEDRDQIEDRDGCPETDADGDLILDERDECPILAGSPPDGCPIADSDVDGIPDHEDNCVLAPEDFDGILDGDGCPEVDADLDRVRDEMDKCPIVPEDYDGDRDDDGCPDDDKDGDGIKDVFDDCPEDRETQNQFLDEDGCPDRVPTFVVTAQYRETAGGTDIKSFNVAAVLTIDWGTGLLTGRYVGTTRQDVTFTCYNVDDPSQTYDTATASYTVSYEAPVKGGVGGAIGTTRVFTISIAPSGTVGATVTRYYTDSHCTKFNSQDPPGLGSFQGSGTLRVVVSPLGQVDLRSSWISRLGTAAGAWDGWGVAT